MTTLSPDTILQEDHVNATEGWYMGDPQRIALRDTIFGENATPGDVFRFSRSEYGRCVSKVYVDSDNGPMAVGWVFQKTERYEDTNEPYLHETWVTLLRRRETRVEVEYENV